MKLYLLLIIFFLHLKTGHSQVSLYTKTVDSLVNVINRSSLQAIPDSSFYSNKIGADGRVETKQKYYLLYDDSLALRKVTWKLATTVTMGADTVKEEMANIFYYAKDKLLKIEGSSKSKKEPGIFQLYFSNDKMVRAIPPVNEEKGNPDGIIFFAKNLITIFNAKKSNLKPATTPPPSPSSL